MTFLHKQIFVPFAGYHGDRNGTKTSAVFA